MVYMRHIWLYILFLIFFFSCQGRKDGSNVIKPVTPLDIKERGKLVAATDYNSTNYFIYRGTPMGFQYDLLKQLAEALDVDLEVKVNNELGDLFDQLNVGQVDL